MKGISPMIAVVLLLAFTVAIGGILSVWLGSLITMQTSTVESITEKQIKCSASNLAVKEVRYVSADLSATRGLVNVTVTYETGAENLYNLTVDVTAGGITNTSSALYVTSTDPFEPGESRALVINTNISSAPEYVRARATCQTSVAVVGECTSGDPCDKGS